MGEDELMTPAQVAAELGVSPTRVRNLADDGVLLAVVHSSRMRMYRRGNVEQVKHQRGQRRGQRARQAQSTEARLAGLKFRRDALCQESARLADLSASVAAELQGVERAIALLGHSADTVSSDNRVTASEAAAMLGVTPQRVRQMAEAGALAVVGTLGRARVYRRADVEQLAHRRQDHA